MVDSNIELACKSCGIPPEQYKQLAEKIIAEWVFKDLPDNEWTKSHFMSALRRKVEPCFYSTLIDKDILKSILAWLWETTTNTTP